MEHAHGIVLRKQPLSDTSLIVTWITDCHGKVRTAARAARRPKSPFAGKLDLFYAAEISFTPSRTSGLHSLCEVASTKPFDATQLRCEGLYLCSYFAELVDLAMQPMHPAPEIFDLMKRAVDHLQSNPATERALVHFEHELCKALGIHSNRKDTLSAINTYCGKIPTSRRKALSMLGVD